MSSLCIIQCSFLENSGWLYICVQEFELKHHWLVLKYILWGLPWTHTDDQQAMQCPEWLNQLHLYGIWDTRSMSVKCTWPYSATRNRSMIKSTAWIGIKNDILIRFINAMYWKNGNQTELRIIFYQDILIEMALLSNIYTSITIQF